MQHALDDVAKSVILAQSRFNELQSQIHESERQLSQANAYQRLCPRLFHDLPHIDNMDWEVVTEGLAMIDNPWMNEPPICPEAVCDWCGDLGHTAGYCPEISQCPLCEEVGHPPDRCPQPHFH